MLTRRRVLEGMAASLPVLVGCAGDGSDSDGLDSGPFDPEPLDGGVDAGADAALEAGSRREPELDSGVADASLDAGFNDEGGDGGGDGGSDAASVDAALPRLHPGCRSDPSQCPNVLFLSIDDLNDWVGALRGHPQAKTPHIDALAARGTLFSNAHCAAPLCNASRVSTLSGIAPWNLGIYANRQPWRPPHPDLVTLPQHFRAFGYHAAGTGKIFHGRYLDPVSWDEYWPGLCEERPPDPPVEGRPINGIPGTGNFDWGPTDLALADMSDAKVADWVAERLQQPKGDKPLFLACGFFRPHQPLFVPQEYFDRFPLEDIELPETKIDDIDDLPPLGVRFAEPDDRHAFVLEHMQWKPAVQAYLASTAFADDMLGRVMSAFDRSPYADNTIIVLWSDHGWHLGEKMHWEKFALWEEATRVPLAVVAPGVTTPGSVCSRPVNLLDLYPTLSELCGLPLRDELEGESLVPLLRDPEAQPDRVSITNYKRGNYAIRTQRWRYIRYGDDTEELYDHDVDPNEWDNLASDPSTEATRLELAAKLPKRSRGHVPHMGGYDPADIECMVPNE